MRQAQLLVYEGDGALAALLRPAAERRRWSLREPRQAERCLRLLASGGPGVLVIRAGRDLEREMTLLERVRWLHPETACVVVGDADHGRLAGLAWDLGAAYVHLPPQPRDSLPEIIAGLMPGGEKAPPGGLP
jgi:hypothetical protein